MLVKSFFSFNHNIFASSQNNQISMILTSILLSLHYDKAV